jgi:hypothetical protein
MIFKVYFFSNKEFQTENEKHPFLYSPFLLHNELGNNYTNDLSLKNVVCKYFYMNNSLVQDSLEVFLNYFKMFNLNFKIYKNLLSSTYYFLSWVD